MHETAGCGSKEAVSADSLTRDRRAFQSLHSVANTDVYIFFMVAILLGGPRYGVVTLMFISMLAEKWDIFSFAQWSFDYLIL